jgi:hypothetical protein
MRSSPLAAARLLVFSCTLSILAHAADPTEAQLQRQFTQSVTPFLDTYCKSCHGTATPAAQFDIKPYTSMAAVVGDFGHWVLVLDKLSSNSMPPKGMKQPTAEVRKAVTDWIQAVRTNEAKKHAGDPGAVLARRLSNAEYNYTIRDLTGVDMKPTREFPVDPANTAGFDNSGESLTMSPALLNKYLQAARDVANHMVLTPDGFDFAPHPMLVETDREKYAIQRIVNFYERQPTDYADYFAASWRYQHRAALGKPNATLASIAGEAKISAKYLPMVWGILDGKEDEAGPVAKLRGMWRDLPAPAGKAEPEGLRAKCVEMRDYVVKLRKLTAMEFAAPVVRGLSAYSPPLINWKFRQFNTHRRDFDREALRMAGDPPLEAPTIPKYPGLGQESAFRAAALMKKARAENPELLTVPDGQREAYEKAFARLANVFPDNFYIRERGRFFPDDSQDKGRLLSAGYHNVMGYWRDDQPLKELILDEKGQQELDRLWIEFDFIGDHTMRTWVQYFFNQSGEVEGRGRESGSNRPSDKEVSAPAAIFALRDLYVKKAEASNNPIAAEASKVHFQWMNDTLRMVEKLRADAEPLHRETLLKFAARAYRRPLTAAEKDDALSFYQTLRDKTGLTHEEAIRDSIVRILMSPKFCYRVDLTSNTAAKPAATVPSQPLPPYALASRLSYFLWSSMPDSELLAHAASGDLTKPEVLAAETRRMLKDQRARGLAVEFGGNWLDFRRFEDINSVDRDRFPSFTNELRQAMFEEPVRFLEDIIRNDRSVLDALYGKYTFVNATLAKHYGMPEPKGDPEAWTRVDDAMQYGRGGVLPMAAFLTQNAPGLRTSPVKRGYWVVRRVLGETIPPPPPNVPELPKDESKIDLPLREMLAQHRSNAACASCHQRFDSMGVVFEGYGPVGEKRSHDLGGRPVETKAAFPGAGEGDGLAGLQSYIRERRQNDFVDNLSRKLLAYALGRSLMLSDDLTIEQMRTAANSKGYRFEPLVEAIVTSPQFRNKRISDLREQKGE